MADARPCVPPLRLWRAKLELTCFNSSVSWTTPSSALVGPNSSTLTRPLSSTLTSMFATGLTGKLAGRLGGTRPEALTAFVRSAWRIREHENSISFKDPFLALRAHILTERTTLILRLQHDPVACHVATRGLCYLSMTPNFNFCTSPFWNLSVRVLNPSSRIFSAFAAMYSWGVLFNYCIRLQMLHQPAKRRQHNQNQLSDRFSHPPQRRQNWH